MPFCGAKRNYYKSYKRSYKKRSYKRKGYVSAYEHVPFNKNLAKGSVGNTRCKKGYHQVSRPTCIRTKFRIKKSCGCSEKNAGGARLNPSGGKPIATTDETDAALEAAIDVEQKPSLITKVITNSAIIGGQVLYGIATAAASRGKNNMLTNGML